MTARLPPSKLPPKVDLTHRSCLVSENSKIACIREFSAGDGGDVGLHFGETALVSTVSPNPTDRVWSCLVEKDDGTCIIVPDHYLVEIDDTSSEWVKPKQQFVALNNAKAAQYNHLDIHTGRVYRYHYSESGKPNMWFMEDVAESTSSTKRVWGWTNIDNVLVAAHKPATEVNYPAVARHYLAKLQNSAASMASSSEAVGKFRELAFDRLCIAVAAYSPTEREPSGLKVRASATYVPPHIVTPVRSPSTITFYVKDCLWDIAGCGFAYGHKKDCLEEGWVPTRCLVDVDMVRVASGGSKVWECGITYEEDRQSDNKTRKMISRISQQGTIGAPESITVNEKGEDIMLHRRGRHHRSRTTSTRPTAQAAAS
ncbi:hypothetical protein FOZ60_015012 [Perkinsus olseni]|uniref:Uncharacterized protein n=1 Tax=Perkinsus olseni TaxID=32597 RepID=A0A7J6P6G3_PEROL|nr:hypothetical protein FOZ60_015012 [Perkinsus olseni]